MSLKFNPFSSSFDLVGSGGTPVAPAWGEVTGTLSDQTDLQTALDAKLDDSQVGVTVQAYSAILAATTEAFTVADGTKLDGIAAGAEVNVNADWNSVGGDSQILNKPTISGSNTGDQTSIVGITGSLAEFNTALTGADFATGGGTVSGTSSGTNTGDQTSIVGISGTIAQFNTACSDADFATGGGTATGTNTGDQDLSGKADLVHTHAASAIISGTVDTARLGSGTANSSSYLRGDQTWATIAGGGDVVGQASSVDSEIALFSGTGGKTIKRATTTGLLKATSGVIAAATGITDYLPGYTIVATLASDQATAASVTPVTLTGLVFSYEANSKYVIEVYAGVAPTAATTGCGFQFDMSTTFTSLWLSFFHQLANTGTLSGGHSVADDASVGVSSGMPGTSTYPVAVSGFLITNANAGTAQLRFRSEVAAVTTCKAGTTLIVRKVA